MRQYNSGDIVLLLFPFAVCLYPGGKDTALSEPNYPFCQIANEGLPSHGLYENEALFVILDRESLGFGHCMVVPKRHVVKVYELDQQEYIAFFELAKRLALQLEAVLKVKAVGLVAFGSGLSHAHLYLVPHNTSRVLLYPHEYAKVLSDEELQAAAGKLRSLLPDLTHESNL